MAVRIQGRMERRFLNRSRIDVTVEQGTATLHGRLADLHLCRRGAEAQSVASARLGPDLHDRDFKPPIRMGAVHAAVDGHSRPEPDTHPDHVLYSDRRADFSFARPGLAGRQIRSPAVAVDRSAPHRPELDPRGQGDNGGDGPLPHLRTAGGNLGPESSTSGSWVTWFSGFRTNAVWRRASSPRATASALS